MKPLFEPGPIITCSTGADQPNAIAVIRLSGFNSLLELQDFFERDLKKVRPRYAHHTVLMYKGQRLDDVLILYFQAPHSYNGESILEIHAHGNPLNIERILELFCQQPGFRRALPGEFTYRAYRNKKLNLSQVEGLDMLLHARSPLCLDQGLELLNGELQATYQQLFQHYLDMRTCVELAIDFSDDVGLEETEFRYKRGLSGLEKLIDQLYRRSLTDDSDLLNPQIVLYGPTNAGKSTLFNLLLGHQRSIVSEIEGTTRDYVSEGLYLGGVNYRLIDTAGIRSTTDQIESQGIELSRGLVERSFFKIALFNLTHSASILAQLLSERSYDLLVLTHADHVEGALELALESVQCPVFIVDLLHTGPIGPDQKTAPIEPLGKSGPIGPLKKIAPIGPDGLVGEVEKLVTGKYKLFSSGDPILIRRHRRAIVSLYNMFNDADATLRDFSDLGVLSHDINRLGASLSELIGVLPPDDVLNNLFSQFCIGK